MYKCDLCHDRIKNGQIPACVEACEKRLGKKKPLFFGEREEILKIAHERAKEINGYIYGEKENGGTATLYVSKVPFDKIDSKLREKKVSLLFGKIENPLRDVNQWAKGFILGPVVSVLGAVGFALYERKQSARLREAASAGKQNASSSGPTLRDYKGQVVHSEDKKEDK